MQSKHPLKRSIGYDDEETWEKQKKMAPENSSVQTDHASSSKTDPTGIQEKHDNDGQLVREMPMAIDN
jgi:hypothetical protein